MSRCECSIRQRQAQVCFPCSRRAEEDHIGTGSHKGEIRQFPQSALGERRLEGEIEPIQRLFPRNACRFEPPGDSLLLASIQLCRQRPFEQCLIGPLLAPGSIQDVRQCCFQVRQVQLFVRSFLHTPTSCKGATPQY